MTSSTASYVSAEIPGGLQATLSGYGAGRAMTGALVALLTFQTGGAAYLATHKPEEAGATTLASSFRQENLLLKLVDFHVRLAASQKDLPDEAARVLRDKLWDLYE